MKCYTLGEKNEITIFFLYDYGLGGIGLISLFVTLDTMS